MYLHLSIMSFYVLLVKIERAVWFTIYHHLPVVKGVNKQSSINQPTNGKRTSMPFIFYPDKLVINPLTSINYRYITCKTHSHWPINLSSSYWCTSIYGNLHI